MNWPRELRRLGRLTGPEDEFDDETNGDPDSTLGEDDEEGFDDDPYGDEPSFDPEDDDDEDE